MADTPVSLRANSIAFPSKSSDRKYNSRLYTPCKKTMQIDSLHYLYRFLRRLPKKQQHIQADRFSDKNKQFIKENTLKGILDYKLRSQLERDQGKGSNTLSAILKPLLIIMITLLYISRNCLSLLSLIAKIAHAIQWYRCRQRQQAALILCYRRISATHSSSNLSKPTCSSSYRELKDQHVKQLKDMRSYQSNIHSNAETKNQSLYKRSEAAITVITNRSVNETQARATPAIKPSATDKLEYHYSSI